ncbi:MAG: GPW/gp25 family protein [Clostridia bacterium]|nr:GPW/gp25 family protein [Clostridia bacterium]MBR2735596.1 GPW/gp25 family protein [Clostridia bacterium]
MNMPVIKGWKFPVQVDEANGKIKTVEDNENIKQSVRMILETRPQERKVVPRFGANLRPYIFETINPSVISSLKNEVEHSIKTWESHVADLNVGVKSETGTVSYLETSVDYITDIEPTQERVTKVLSDTD